MAHNSAPPSYEEIETNSNNLPHPCRLAAAEEKIQLLKDEGLQINEQLNSFKAAFEEVKSFTDKLTAEKHMFENRIDDLEDELDKERLKSTLLLEHNRQIQLLNDQLSRKLMEAQQMAADREKSKDKIIADLEGELEKERLKSSRLVEQNGQMQILKDQLSKELNETKEEKKKYNAKEEQPEAYAKYLQLNQQLQTEFDAVKEDSGMVNKQLEEVLEKQEQSKAEYEQLSLDMVILRRDLLLMQNKMTQRAHATHRDVSHNNNYKGVVLQQPFNLFAFLAMAVCAVNIFVMSKFLP
uniref:Uncharacterized protein n=1 Tax=Stomoxys calcitrans TaxID=35570 RepID=A0A1I8PEN1_STOCA